MVSREQFVLAAEQLAPSLYRVCLSILRQPQDAQDAVQESLVKAFARLDKIRPDTLGPYLMRIAINESRNIQRQRRRFVPMEQLPKEGQPMETRDLDLRAVLDQLPDSLRLPILLYYLEGWTDPMIARALNISQVALRTRKSRGRRLLKQYLTQDQAGGEAR